MPTDLRRITDLSAEERALLVLQNAGHYAILICDPQGKIIEWNPAAEQVFGWTAEQAVGQSADLIFTPEDKACGRMRVEMDTAASEGMAQDERWHLRVDGGRFWASGQMVALHEDGKEGEPIGYAKIVRDRTAERQMQDRLRIAQEAGGIGSFELFPATGRILTSEYFCRLWGVPPQPEFDVDDFIRLIHPEDRDLVVTGGRALPDNALDYIEYRIVRPDTGEIRWLGRRGEMVPGAGHENGRYVGVVYDITERKRVEQDLRFIARASAELGSLADAQGMLEKLADLSVPSFAHWCTVDLLNPDGSLSRVAAAHADAVKAPLLDGQPAREDAGGLVALAVWQSLRTGKPELISEITDEMMARESGTVGNPGGPGQLAELRELGLRSFMAVPLLLRGAASGVLCFAGADSARRYSRRDLGIAEELARRAAVALENARLYQELREADRGKDAFLAMLGHELRNPLSAMTNGLTVMRLSGGNPEKTARSMALMERQAAQMSRLLDDMLDLSRINTGKIELKKEWINLVALLGGVAESSRALMEGARHDFSVSLPETPVMIYADPVRLSQVYSNLIGNAVKYTPPGGRIELGMRVLPDAVAVQVRDTGIGIARDMLRKVFNLFAQARHPMDRSQGGLGIGLAVVDSLVRMHGGAVEARSDGPGQGSEFIVTLPLERDSSQAGDSDSARETRVLVADDRTDAADVAARILVLLGHAVEVAHTGHDALAAVSARRPHAVLLNPNLPDMRGEDVAAAVRATAGGRDIVLIAVDGQSDRGPHAAPTRFDAHWSEPVGPELLRRVAGMIAEKSGQAR